MKYDAFSMEMPKLIDHTTGAYMYEILRQCHDNRIHTYSWVFNILVVTVFVGVGALVLYLCMKRKPSAEERKEKLLLDQKIILEKIRSLKEQKQSYYEESSYTHLPFLEPQVSNHVV